MKYVKLLVALLAVCTLIIIPAFSMPDCGNAMKDCKKQIDSPCQGPIKGDIADGQQPCLCPEDKMGPGGDKCAPRSMMDGKKEMNGCDKPTMGQDDMKPMADGCDKPMMGQDGCKCAPKPMNGPDGDKYAPRPMNGPEDGMDQECPCHSS